MKKSSVGYARPVYVIDGARSPFLTKAKGRGPFSASDLAVGVGKTLLMRQLFDVRLIEEVILGCVMPTPHETNIARLVALRLGLPISTPARTVQRNCASGLEAIDCAAQNIASGRHHLVLAGGVDAMSRAPVLWATEFVDWLTYWMSAKSVGSRIQSLSKIRPSFLAPIFGLQCGLTDPIVNMNMGQTAEQLAYQFRITRDAMDEFSMRSHQRSVANQAFTKAEEIQPIFDHKGIFYQEDEGIRSDCTVEALAKLKPAFDKPYGQVTAGNSSRVTDGSALVILASEEAVQHYRLPVLAKLIDCEWAGLAPDVMGLGPVYSTTPLLQRHHLLFDDVDFFEVNEAFAAQVLSCLKAWTHYDFCVKELGLKQVFGSLDESKLNIEGGAIALGHPVGATGARLVLHMAHLLKRHQKQRGVVTLCIGGGQGGAMLMETVS